MIFKKVAACTHLRIPQQSQTLGASPGVERPVWSAQPAGSSMTRDSASQSVIPAALTTKRVSASLVMLATFWSTEVASMMLKVIRSVTQDVVSGAGTTKPAQAALKVGFSMIMETAWLLRIAAGHTITKDSALDATEAMTCKTTEPVSYPTTTKPPKTRAANFGTGRPTSAPNVQPGGFSTLPPEPAFRSTPSAKPILPQVHVSPATRATT